MWQDPRRLCAKRMKIKIVVNMIVVGLVMLAGSIYVTIY